MNISANIRWPNLAESIKKHIFTSKPFIWAYKEISMAFHSVVLVLTRKRWQTHAPNLQFSHFSGRQNYQNHIYTSRPFIWAYSKVVMPFRSKAVARANPYLKKHCFRLRNSFWPNSSPYKKTMIDGWTNKHSKTSQTQHTLTLQAPNFWVEA